MKDDDEQAREAARILGRLGGSRGGRARAEKLTPQRRSEISQQAARARWGSRETAETLHTDDQTGLAISMYAGPEVARGSRRRYQITRQDGKHLDFSVQEWIALMEWGQAWMKD